MSIVGNLRSVQDADLDAVLERPERVKRLVYNEPLGRDDANSRPLLARFRRRKHEPEDDWGPADDGEHLDLDKAWQGLHFLLTGTDMGGDPPLNFIYRPENWIGDVDVGLGPARAVRSGEVRMIADELERLPPETLAERFDPEKMMELGIYPEIWDRDPAEDDTLGYLLHHYGELRAFVRRAADGGRAMIVYF